MRERLMVIDGHSLIYRAFFAMPELTNEKGEPTGAIYGFLLMLQRLLADENPDYLVVAFDSPGPTFRHEAYTEYKAHRPPMPDTLRPQVGRIRELLTAYGIETLAQEGLEADDLLGCLAQRGSGRGLDVLLVTGDRDSLQLVNDQVNVLLTRKGITDLARFGPSEVLEKYGVPPQGLIDHKALVGDASDNIPGVPGIGEKTATKLLLEYQDLEGVLAHAHEIKGKLGERLRENQDLARISRRLAQIVCDAPLELSWEEIRRQEPRWEEVLDLATQLGFKDLAQQARERLTGGEAPVSAQGIPAQVITAIHELELWVKALNDGLVVGEFFFSPENQLVGLALSQGKDPIYLPIVPHSFSDQMIDGLGDEALRLLRPVLADHKKAVFGSKRARVYLARLGYELGGVSIDPEVAGYLLSPGETITLEGLAQAHLGQALMPWPAKKPAQLSESQVSHGVGGRLEALAGLVTHLQRALEEAQLLDLYQDLEHPLIEVLGGMELRGIAIDRRVLMGLQEEFESSLKELTQTIYHHAGGEFNINSPKQLGKVLFEDLGLPVLKKTKTGPSTAAEVLEQLASEHPMVEHLLTYRQLSKLKSTYVDALLQLADASGRVYTTFHQTVTATGRLSSADPNLQNIPIRSDVGGQIRKAFIPTPSWVLVGADYSQIELRILAHVADDPTLIDSFIQGEDIHTRTASEVFGVPLDEVDSRMRSEAKAINFGIVYGISSFGLARGTGISRVAAQEYIDRYFARYPGVHRYLEEVVAQAKADGYVTTLLGRRRYLPDLQSRNFQVRSFAERTAMNTPIQGTAADLIKLAMVRVANRLTQERLQARLLLQVHDELLLEAPPQEVEEVQAILRDEMEGVVQLKVPLKADLASGASWAELKG